MRLHGSCSFAFVSGVAVVSAVSAVLLSAIPADAAPKTGTSNIGGVTVRRNPDGSIETFDDELVQSVDAGSAAPPTRGHTRTGTSNIGGVTVRKNPDGSIETFDNEGVPSRPSSYRRPIRKKTGRPAAVVPARGARVQKTVRKTTYTRPGGFRSMGGVYVRRNADGSIETSD